jgi:putative ubiquitin-RnfH superfamily antitoxin RatB of RatAB toxin-antitoxin module
VEVVYCPAGAPADVVSLQLPAGSVLAEALAASQLATRHGLALDELKVGVWGRVREPQTPLRDLDRVEIYRALRVDPKEARRLRYKRQSR